MKGIEKTACYPHCSLHFATVTIEYRSMRRLEYTLLSVCKIACTAELPTKASWPVVCK